MSRRIVTTLAIVFSMAFSSMAAAANGQPISHAQLEVMFKNMREGAPWNVDGPLLWGYFFTNKQKAPLEDAAKVLAARGYRVVEIYRNDKAWWLHVDKVERHTVDSLDERNAEFYAFAKQQGLESYDGMDVGPAS
jgi:hypothetical protein